LTNSFYNENSTRIAVIGLGYVGLPVAIAIATKFSNTIGFDINQSKVLALQQGIDWTGEIDSQTLCSSTLKITSELTDLETGSFFVVAVPTPVSIDNQPDLTPLIKASETIGKVIKPGAIVVYESTVYPGVTEEICGPILEKVSGLKQGIDFKLGYSPERINPGDKKHTLEKIVKVVSGEDLETLETIAAVYSRIIDAGIHRASSIKVAEMSKVIENTQRDINIAFMNELALICDRLQIRTQDVLDAARTKWNFLPFSPGLVGGHCIGVDPYYLTTKAESLGYHPEVILSGRRINDGMGRFIAQKLVKLLSQSNVSLLTAKVGILGLTFKENVPDLRNSRVPDIAAELQQFNVHPIIHDPLANSAEAIHEYGIPLTDWSEFQDLDALILAVPHQQYLDISAIDLCAKLKNNGVLIDIKSIHHPQDIPQGIQYWSL
jgi:UDP-N-acetyl-D-glucosamine/UDP-N-acetyl-D-galactosamine dehydrogenase